MHEKHHFVLVLQIAYQNVTNAMLDTIRGRWLFKMDDYQHLNVANVYEKKKGF